MEIRTKYIVSVLVVGIMIGAILLPLGLIGLVVAPVDPPHNIWGDSDEGPDTGGAGAVGIGSEITGWIDGVNYGSNTTFDPDGAFDLYVLGDEWGDAISDARKDGGYEGDEIMYFLRYSPSDYTFNISTTTTSWHNLSFTNYVPAMFFDTQTWTDFNYPNTNLRGLKINEIALNDGGGGSYVYLYDPGGALDEAALEDPDNGYYLQMDDDFNHDPDGPIFEFDDNPTLVENFPVGSNYYFVNTSSLSLTTEGELKLVWKNPAIWGVLDTADNIANGSDVIVDRVEWGNFTNTNGGGSPPIDRDYDNTILMDYVGTMPIAGESFNRTSPGFDTDDCSFDFEFEASAMGVPSFPWTVDYIQIRSASGGLGSIVSSITLDVGQSVTIWAAAYNDTGGYLGDYVCTWTESSLGTVITVTPLGASTNVQAQLIGGGSTITVDYGGEQNTTSVTVNPPAADTIIITDAPDGAELGEFGPVVISVGGQVLAYASGYNTTTGGYVGLVEVDWGDAPDLGDFNNDTGTSTTFTATSDGSTTVTGVNASMTDTFDITINPLVGGIPGAPTELRVHKGNGAWGGGVDDLVLKWTAPTWNYTFLKFNIVYWDTDLSDGFQYTSYWLCDSNSTGAGTEDGCVLPGFLATSFNYTFRVNTTNDTKGSFENMTGTNVGYCYGEVLLKNADPLLSQMFISIPYNSDWKKAEDVTKEFTDGSIISGVYKWNYTTQDYDWRTYFFGNWNQNFTINPGDCLAVSITTTSPTIWRIVGSHNDSLNITFLKNTDPLLSQKYVSLPYHKMYEKAEDLANTTREFPDGSIISGVYKWNYALQDYDWRTYFFGNWNGNFTIDPVPGGHLAVSITTTAEYYWFPEVKAF